MIHSRSPPPRTPQRRRRPTNSGRILLGSAKSIKQDEPIILTDQKVQFETNNNNNNISKRKKFFVIAPDVFIPNSTYRTVFKRKEIKPVVTKEFQLRLDILNNLPRANSSFLGDEDDEWMELDDPDQPTKPTSAKKTRALNTPVSQQKETVPDLFKRMQNEPWWKQGKDEKSNMRSMLLYLIEIIKLKQTESYESACFYVIEVFRSYGIEPTYINQVLNIFRENLKINANEQLDICTIRSIAQFMIERKDIIIYLLEYAIKCQSMDNIRLEVINAIKFITDVNNSEEIDLVLENMSAVYNSPEEDFSLQAIIKLLQKKSTTVPSEETTEEEPRDETHPLLRKISEERWFPRGQLSITLDCVLDAIITKLQDTTKTMVKTLTTHLIQLHRNIGYTIEQFDRVSKSLISLLSNIDADYRLIAATSLAQFDKETKTIDIALLKSFINDPRILVRTECCDSLKKLTGVMSDIVLTDCANDIEHLQTLPEENFSLESYLREKNRLPTPPPRHVDEPPIVSVEEVPPIRSPSPPLPPVNEQSTTVDPVPPPVKPEAIPVSHTESLTSSMTSIRPSIRVEINDKQNNIRKERPSIQIARKSRQSNASSVPDQKANKRTILLPNNAQMWDSYNKQIDNESNFIRAPQSSSINSEHEKDSVQILLEEHKQNVGFYRLARPRRILVPHKISMENIFSEQSHLINNQFNSQAQMNLSDFNHNQYQLNEVEFVQLLSSLIIRAIQVHKQYDKFIAKSTSPSFVNALNISQVHLHATSIFQQTYVSGSSKLQGLGYQRPTSRQFIRMQTNIQTKAAREGISLHKAQHMESILSNLLKINRERTKSTMFSSSVFHSQSASKQVDITHAWLLSQLLTSQGVNNSETYILKIIHAYPKFIPLLHMRIPDNLIPLIWDDPVMKQLVSIVSHKRDPSSPRRSPVKRYNTKTSISSTEDDYSYTCMNYSTLINNRDDQRKKFLPIIRGSKMNLPRQVTKFSIRQIETDTSDISSVTGTKEETKPSANKQRVQMHVMMPSNEHMFDRSDSTKSPVRSMLKSDGQGSSYVSIVTRPPLYH